MDHVLRAGLRNGPIRRTLPFVAIAVLTLGSHAYAALDAYAEWGELRENSLERSAEPPRAVSGATQDAAVRLLDEANAAYQAQRWDPAMDAFKAVVALEPENAHAWLRIGNIHQRRKQWLTAASAYRKAEQRFARTPSGDVMRARALLNLAAVNLEMAESALERAHAILPADQVGPLDLQRQQLAGHSAALRGRIDEDVRRTKPISGQRTVNGVVREELASRTRASIGLTPPVRAASAASIRQTLPPAASSAVRAPGASAASPPSTPMDASVVSPNAPSLTESTLRGPSIEYLRGGPVR